MLLPTSHPRITIRTATDLRGGEWFCRAWAGLQRGLAFCLLVMVSPILLMAYLGIRITSPGPFLFKQQRTGYQGRWFVVYKVRTMTVGSEKQTALGVQRQDPAIFPFGKLLRDLKIDELPQLWNIVRGDMLLVGPRPIPVALDQELRRRICGFACRYQVKPGLTNVAQVCIEDNLLHSELAEDWGRRLDADLHYIAHRRVAYDMIVLCLTSLYLIRRVRSLLASSLRVTTNKTLPSYAIPATRVAGVPVANADYDAVIDRFRGWIRQPLGRMVGVCPVHSLMASLLNHRHRLALMSSDLNTADGMPVVWTQKLMGFADASRVYGPTLMLKTLDTAAKEGWRVGFFGGHPDRLEAMRKRFEAIYPDLKVALAVSPPFGELSKQQNDAYIQQINEAAPDILWVGLGSPKQEVWMHEHRDRLNTVIVGVGAAFDFHAGAVRQAPSVLQKLGLEWAFRLSQEPKRLFIRYATANPVFIALFFKQLVERFVFFRWRSFQTVMPVRSQDARLAAVSSKPTTYRFTHPRQAA